MAKIPYRADLDLRTYYVQVRLTASERATLEKAAKQRMTLSAYLREKAIGR